MKTIRVRPILLPTKEYAKTGDLIDVFGNLIIADIDMRHHHKQQLILISLEDETICQGDSVVWANQIFEVCNSKAYSNTNFIRAEFCNTNNIPKVIATQEQLSPELTQQLVGEYNNGEMKDFEIEMMYRECPNSSIENWNYFPKPLLTNGFVTAVEKESILYTEKEVLKLLDKLLNINCSFTKEDGSQCIIQKGLPYTLQEWFNQNKKK